MGAPKPVCVAWGVAGARWRRRLKGLEAPPGEGRRRWNDAWGGPRAVGRRVGKAVDGESKAGAARSRGRV